MCVVLSYVCVFVQCPTCYIYKFFARLFHFLLLSKFHSVRTISSNITFTPCTSIFNVHFLSSPITQHSQSSPFLFSIVHIQSFLLTLTRSAFASCSFKIAFLVRSYQTRCVSSLVAEYCEQGPCSSFILVILAH